MIEPQAIAPDLWRIPLSLRGHSVGHVNIYVMVGDDGALLVDTGWSKTRDALVEALHRIGLDLPDIQGVLTTHLHADHCGLAKVLQDCGASVGMHAADAADLPRRFFDRDFEFAAALDNWCAAVGLPTGDREAARLQLTASAENVDEFMPDRFLADGERVKVGTWDVEIIHTPGHTPGHACFYEHITGLLFTGDHVFPRIRANATARPFSTPDPIGSYLASLDRLEQLRVTKALPGHQEPFPDFTARLASLRQYHRQRMHEVADRARVASMTTFQIAATLHRSSKWNGHQLLARLTAIGETHAHLLRLEREGHVKRVEELPIRWRHV